MSMREPRGCRALIGGEFRSRVRHARRRQNDVERGAPPRALAFRRVSSRHQAVIPVLDWEHPLSCRLLQRRGAALRQP
jgi:hypothetical protein